MCKSIPHFNVAIVLAFALLFISNNSYARDISNEQRAVSEAREAQNRAKANLDTNNQQIAEIEKRIADEEAQLKQLKIEQKAAQARLDKANADLARDLKVLEQAWPERNR